MNDFGTALAPAVAYLPTTNQDRDNLQWAVRLNGEYRVICSVPIIYTNIAGKTIKNVQFSIKLKDETIRIPRQKVTVKNGTYFLWPFNQELSNVLLEIFNNPTCLFLKRRQQPYLFLL